MQGELAAQVETCDALMKSERDWTAAAHWCGIAARDGDAHSQVAYARLLDFGRGVAVDHDEALAWYKKAATQGDSHAIDVLAQKAAREGMDAEGFLEMQPRRGATPVLETLPGYPESRDETVMLPGPTTN